MAPDGVADDTSTDAVTQDAETSEKAERDEYFKRFRSEKEAILAEVAAGTSSDGVQCALDALVLRVQALQETFTRSSNLFSKYDLQKYPADIRAVTESIARRREELAPRKKFSFKRKDKDPATKQSSHGGGDSTGDAVGASGATPTQVEVAATAGVYEGELFEGLSATSVVRGPGALAGRDVTLRALEGCRITLLDHIGALHCHGLRRCEILVGAIESSALFYDCRECVITLAAKQLRFHDSECISLHLYTCSGPVIEHCKRVLISPYDIVYAQIDDHWAAAGLGERKNATASGAWSDMQDFNWHRRQASPNWAIVPAELWRAMQEFADASNVISDPSPPVLDELERCRCCWEAAEALASSNTT